MPDNVVKKLRELQAEMMLESSKRVGLSTVVNMLVNESLRRRENGNTSTYGDGEFVTKAIEDTLKEMSPMEYSTIKNRLSKDYNISLSDCVNYPEYLKRVLQDIYGNAYTPIIAKIKEKSQESNNSHNEFFEIFSK